MGERGSLEVDDVALRIGEGIGGESDETGSGEGVKVDVELLAVDSEGEVGVELAGGAGGGSVEGAENRPELAVLLRGGLVEALSGGTLGRAEVAVAAGAQVVRGVAEVLDESRHAALRGFGEAGHAIDLGTAERELAVVAGTPVIAAGRSQVACDIHCGGSLGDEFFGGTLEGLKVEPELLAQIVGLLELRGERAGQAGELVGRRIIPLQEEVVHLAVGEGVQKHGSGRIAVSPGSSDLLVVGFYRSGESGVDDAANVSLVDSHAKGDGGNNDLELAREEVALNPFAGRGIEAGMIGRRTSAQLRGQFFG